MLFLTGINHKTAAVEIREQFVFSPEDITHFVSLFSSEKSFGGMVVLSTCNRTEIYTALDIENPQIAFSLIEEKLKLFKNFNGNLKESLYNKTNEGTVNHLFNVISGLDSMALGEYQVVGQVKAAMQISVEGNFIGKVLNRLFQKAFETGKKVRTKTKINKGAVTVSYAAVEAAYRHFNNLNDKKVLSIGAGETGQLVLANLIKKGCSQLYVANRTYEKAVKVANTFKAKAIKIEEVDRVILDYDIILVSTASKMPLITANKVEKLMQKRNDKNLLLIDLSVPRNIEPTVRGIKNVDLYDVDDLQFVVKENYEMRKGEIIFAQEIIEKRVSEFAKWLHSQRLSPTFAKVSENFKTINRREIQGFQKNKVKIDYSKAIEYGDHITDKYIRLLTRNIRNITDNGKRQEYIKVVNELFEL